MKKLIDWEVKMNNKIFTKEEVKILSKNKYVKNVSEKTITYTYEFNKEQKLSSI